MSFSSQVKDEIAKIEQMPECCEHAMTYGLLLFAREFSRYGISIMTEHESVAMKYSSMILRITGVKATTKVSKAGKYTVSIDDEKDIDKVLSCFSLNGNESFSRINRGNLLNETGGDDILNCCNAAFFRGAFLSCGTVSDPNKSYHIEFAVPYRKLSFDLQKLLSESDIPAKHMVRRGINVIYIKDSQKIEDLLNTMGAYKSAFELMDIKIYRDVINVTNRRTNFDEANASRIADAACKQINAIRKIRESGTFELLDPQLRQIAEFREEYPEASLRDLGEMFSPALTRSAVNCKLKKLESISIEVSETFEE